MHSHYNLLPVSSTDDYQQTLTLADPELPDDLPYSTTRQCFQLKSQAGTKYSPRTGCFFHLLVSFGLPLQTDWVSEHELCPVYWQNLGEL